MKTPKDKSERLSAAVTGSEKIDPTLQELADIERRLRKAMTGDRPPSEEELAKNADPLDGNIYRDEVADPTPAQLRDWWRAVSQVWLTYAREAARNQTEDPIAELALIMGRTAAELSSGILPQSVAGVVVRGNPPISYWEGHDIGVAVAYREACKKGGILHNSRMVQVDDHHPTRTIMEAYGVTDSTVRAWCRRYPPVFLGVNDITAEVLTAILKSSGARYRQAGRSFSAISRRNAKA
jgi:hypothetical protein